MAWRGTNSLRCFDAQGDHSAQSLLTHSDRTEPTSVIAVGHRVFRVVTLAHAACSDSHIIEIDADMTRRWPGRPLRWSPAIKPGERRGGSGAAGTTRQTGARHEDVATGAHGHLSNPGSSACRPGRLHRSLDSCPGRTLPTAYCAAPGSRRRGARAGSSLPYLDLIQGFGRSWGGRPF